MIERQYVDRTQYEEGAWRGRLIGGSGHLIVYGVGQGNGVGLPEVVRLIGNKHRFLPGPEPEVRTASLEEAVLLVEALPDALRGVQNRESVYMSGRGLVRYEQDDLKGAQSLAESLIEQIGTRLEVTDHINRLSAVRNALTDEGLIPRREQG